MPKKIFVILVVALLVLCFSVLTFGYDDIKSVLSIKSFILTDEQKLELIEKAEIFGVEASGLSDEQLFFAVQAKENEAMIEKAKSAGVHTDGLTADQVRIEIEKWDKEIALRRTVEEKNFYIEEAKRFGIDTEGLSFDEKKERVNEKQMPLLIKKAEAFGLKYEGLNYDQLLRLVKEEEIKIILSSEVSIPEKGTNQELDSEALPPDIATKPDHALPSASVEVNLEEAGLKQEPEAASTNEQTVPAVQIPLITTGIDAENSSEYTGYVITINRGSLPEWAQGFSRIGIADSYITGE